MPGFRAMRAPSCSSSSTGRRGGRGACRRVEELCAAGGAGEMRVAADDAERATLW